MESKADILKEVTDVLIGGSKINAKSLIDEKYPFVKHTIFHRSYTINQKMNIFLRDGFIDRYTAEKLVIPGMLKVLSDYYPESFPYHKNGKMTEGHFAYWEIFPTIDHVIPIAAGGADAEGNWVTTSMLNNSIKANWTLKQLKWELHESGDIKEWDGLTQSFLNIVNRDKTLLQDTYIQNWYNAALKCLHL